MIEVLLCNQSIKPNQLKNQCDLNINHITGASCVQPDILISYTPYLVGQNPSAIDRGILNQLTPMSVARELTNFSLSFGENNVIALANITSKLQEFNIGLLGASTSTYANRIGGFAGVVANYQSALMEYRQAMFTNPATKNIAKQKAQAAFQKMQSGFRHELAVVTAPSHSRRGTPLTSVERATNIAKSSRHVAKLNVVNQIQANHLVKLSQHAKFLGNGLAVIDFGSRIGKVHNSYQADGDWERDLFIESSSFAFSAIAGTIAVNVGSSALSFLPDWVGGIDCRRCGGGWCGGRCINCGKLAD